MTTLLVTGATGFLGQAVVRLLLQDYPEYRGAIRILCRRRQAVPTWWDVEVVEGDLRDSHVSDRAVGGCQEILHVAGISSASSPTLYHAVNVEGTRRLVEAVRQHRVRRFVFVSSRLVDPVAGGYAVSKQLAEHVIMEAFEDFVIVRLAELYGEGDSRGIMPLVSWMQRHRWVPVMGSGRYILAPLHVDDAASAVISALKIGNKGGIYTVTGPEQLTYNELVDAIAHALNVRCVKLFVPTWLASAGVQLVARWSSQQVAYDQVNRLVAPRAPMEPDTPHRLGLTFRRLSEELPRLVAVLQGNHRASVT